MVNTTYVVCFEPILCHAFVRNPKEVKIMPEEPKGKICDSGWFHPYGSPILGARSDGDILPLGWL